MSAAGHAVLVQTCSNCFVHQWCTRHKEQRYIQNFRRCAAYLQRAFPGLSVSKVSRTDGHHLLRARERLLGKEEGIDAATLGAFQVYFDQVLIFSKHLANRWPRLDELREAVELGVETFQTHGNLAQLEAYVLNKLAQLRAQRGQVDETENRDQEEDRSLLGDPQRKDRSLFRFSQKSKNTASAGRSRFSVQAQGDLATNIDRMRRAVGKRFTAKGPRLAQLQGGDCDSAFPKRRGLIRKQMVSAQQSDRRQLMSAQQSRRRGRPVPEAQHDLSQADDQDQLQMVEQELGANYSQKFRGLSRSSKNYILKFLKVLPKRRLRTGNPADHDMRAQKLEQLLGSYLGKGVRAPKTGQVAITNPLDIKSIDYSQEDDNMYRMRQSGLSSAHQQASEYQFKPAKLNLRKMFSKDKATNLKGETGSGRLGHNVQSSRSSQSRRTEEQGSLAQRKALPSQIQSQLFQVQDQYLLDQKELESSPKIDEMRRSFTHQGRLSQKFGSEKRIKQPTIIEQEIAEQLAESMADSQPQLVKDSQPQERSRVTSLKEQMKKLTLQSLLHECGEQSEQLFEQGKPVFCVIYPNQQDCRVKFSSYLPETLPISPTTDPFPPRDSSRFAPPSPLTRHDEAVNTLPSPIRHSVDVNTQDRLQPETGSALGHQYCTGPAPESEPNLEPILDSQSEKSSPSQIQKPMAYRQSRLTQSRVQPRLRSPSQRVTPPHLTPPPKQLSPQEGLFTPPRIVSPVQVPDVAVQQSAIINQEDETLMLLMKPQDQPPYEQAQITKLFSNVVKEQTRFGKLECSIDIPACQPQLLQVLSKVKCRELRLALMALLQLGDSMLRRVFDNRGQFEDGCLRFWRYEERWRLKKVQATSWIQALSLEFHGKTAQQIVQGLSGCAFISLDTNAKTKRIWKLLRAHQQADEALKPSQCIVCFPAQSFLGLLSHSNENEKVLRVLQSMESGGQRLVRLAGQNGPFWMQFSKFCQQFQRFAIFYGGQAMHHLEIELPTLTQPHKHIYYFNLAFERNAATSFRFSLEGSGHTLSVYKEIEKHKYGLDVRAKATNFTKTFAKGIYLIFLEGFKPHWDQRGLLLHQSGLISLQSTCCPRYRPGKWLQTSQLGYQDLGQLFLPMFEDPVQSREKESVADRTHMSRQAGHSAVKASSRKPRVQESSRIRKYQFQSSDEEEGGVRLAKWSGRRGKRGTGLEKRSPPKSQKKHLAGSRDHGR